MAATLYKKLLRYNVAELVASAVNLEVLDLLTLTTISLPVIQRVI